MQGYHRHKNLKTEMQIFSERNMHCLLHNASNSSKEPLRTHLNENIPWIGFTFFEMRLSKYLSEENITFDSWTHAVKRTIILEWLQYLESQCETNKRTELLFESLTSAEQLAICNMIRAEPDLKSSSERSEQYR
jgi:hypothetical protein